MSLRGATFETSDESDFKDAVSHFSVFNLPFRVADSIVNSNYPYRYIRFKSPALRNGNIAEVEFFGKLNGIGNEVKLTGELIGYEDEGEFNLYPFKHAMDGNLETFFEKKDGTNRWVGLDLGAQNKYHVTRLRFCPRSDTNFILLGDTYELKYWDGEWKSFGVQLPLVKTFILIMSVLVAYYYCITNRVVGRKGFLLMKMENRFGGNYNENAIT